MLLQPGALRCYCLGGCYHFRPVCSNMGSMSIWLCLCASWCQGCIPQARCVPGQLPCGQHLRYRIWTSFYDPCTGQWDWLLQWSFQSHLVIHVMSRNPHTDSLTPFRGSPSLLEPSGTLVMPSGTSSTLEQVLCMNTHFRNPWFLFCFSFWCPYASLLCFLLTCPLPVSFLMLHVLPIASMTMYPHWLPFPI